MIIILLQQIITLTLIIILALGVLKFRSLLVACVAALGLVGATHIQSTEPLYVVLGI